MNEMIDKQNGIVPQSIELFPIPIDETTDMKRFHKIPIGELASMGVGFDSIAR